MSNITPSYRIKILNLVLDEKFIDGLIKTNNLIEEESHDYVFVTDQKDYRFRYISKCQEIKILGKKEIISFININGYDAVFLHSLNVIPPIFLMKIPKRIPVFWFSWGFDVYDNGINKPLIPIKTLQSRTSDFVKAHIGNISSNKSLRAYIKFLIKKLSIHRVNFHSGVLDYETELIRQYNPLFSANRVQFNYINPNQDTGFKVFSGHNILIGNSAAITNNHLDLFEYIKDKNIGKSKIYMPLSYASPNKEYTNLVVQQYSSKFGSQFHPMIEFIPVKEYYDTIQSCAFAIYFIERQQALGNIYEGFRTGRKIFLSETSGMFEYFKKKGYHIFSIQSELVKDDAFIPLSEKQQFENYQLWITTHNQWKQNRETIRHNIITYNQIHNNI